MGGFGFGGYLWQQDGRIAHRSANEVRLTEVPEGVALRVGTTCSVLVKTGTADAGPPEGVTPAPKALQ